MTIKYLDSKRLEGVAGDLTSPSLTSGTGGWKEIARVSGSNTSKTMTVDLGSNPPEYLMYLTFMKSGSSNIDVNLKLGTGTISTGSDYTSRLSSNGNTSGATNINIAYIRVDPNMYNNTTSRFSMGYISNKSGSEKLAITHTVDGKGTSASDAPDRAEVTGKWDISTGQADQLQINNMNGGGSSYIHADSELVVLGYNPTDTHTNNFWEELYTTTLGANSTTISTGTITAKKYLWMQVYCPPQTHDFNLQFNSDPGSTSTRRRSENGGADSTTETDDRVKLGSYNSSAGDFYNIFIVNNSTNEKMGIVHNANSGSSGSNYAPNRSEYVFKWANTSASITSITALQQSGGSGTFGTGTIMKVWGHD